MLSRMESKRYAIFSDGDTLIELECPPIETCITHHFLLEQARWTYGDAFKLIGFRSE